MALHATAFVELAKAPDGVGWKYSANGRILAIGDLHGDVDSLLAVLSHLGLIDKEGKWSGGDTQIVLMGDLMSRGAHTRLLMDYVRDLSAEASRSKGAVFSILGNHEYRAAKGQTAPGPDEASFLSYGPSHAEVVRKAMEWQNPRDRPEALRQVPLEKALYEWSVQLAAQRAYCEPRSPYALQIAQPNSLLQLGDIIFAHSNLPPELFSDANAAGKINAQIRREIRESQQSSAQRVADDVITEERGAGMSLTAAEVLQTSKLAYEDVPVEQVDGIFFRMKLKYGVIGHVSTDNHRVQRIYHRIFRVDTNLSRAMRQHDNETLSVLEFVDGHPVERNDIARPKNFHPLRPVLEARYVPNWGKPTISAPSIRRIVDLLHVPGALCGLGLEAASVLVR